MIEMSKLSELAPKIFVRETGTAISFAEYLEDQAANGELYTPTIKEMLTAALDPNTEWATADDLLAPIAREIISEAIQLNDKTIYIQLANFLLETWEQLANVNVSNNLEDVNSYVNE
jgi:hypothetical protein